MPHAAVRSATMLQALVTRLKSARQEGVSAPLPRIGVLIVSVVLATSAYILLAVADAPPHQRHFHFIDERGAITVLSAVYLAMSAAFSIGAFVVNLLVRDSSRWLWIALALTLAFLSLDELMQFHERLGRRLGEQASSGPFRNWNDLVVIAYGVAALPLAAVFLPSLLRYRFVLELFAAAALCYAVHTTIDSTVEPSTDMSVIAEESCKLMCGAFLLLSTFVGFLGALSRNGLGSSSRSATTAPARP